MKILRKLKSKVVAFFAVATALALPAVASANNDIASIGTQAATEIAKFAVMVSAIGAAVLSIVVLIQGFRMAFRMVRTAA